MLRQLSRDGTILSKRAKVLRCHRNKAAHSVCYEPLSWCNRMAATEEASPARDAALFPDEPVLLGELAPDAC
jgi:hypothetical protein